ncbi:olfactory receptor 6N1-like [Carassius auratus]|uniref:Olfactory receptor 6N1-like n=1 Tax=Carassius auratus TaxID=7957 RepID=A0A6P6PJ13_CARAU|nr:olfactory receptor 6N1-like [Carassius auratus]
MAAENYSVKNVDSFIITGFDHLQNQKLLGFLILLTYMLILLGNGINLCIISTNGHLHKPMYILICNLAVVDIMFSSTCSTTMISVLLAEIKTVSYYSCISRTYFYHLGDFTECMALTLMAIDRLIAIRLPLRYHSIVTNSRTFLFIFLTWLASFAVIGFVISKADSAPYCQPVIRYVFCNYASLIRAACVNPEPYFFITTIISLGPICGQFPFILCTYAVLAYSVTRLSNSSSKKQMISTCSSHLIVLFSYYAPKLVSILLTRIGVELNLTERNAVLIVASLVSPLINPTIYCTRTKEIRKLLADIFLHTKNCTKLNQIKSVSIALSS